MNDSENSWVWGAGLWKSCFQANRGGYWCFKEWHDSIGWWCWIGLQERRYIYYCSQAARDNWETCFWLLWVSPGTIGTIITIQFIKSQWECFHHFFAKNVLDVTFSRSTGKFSYVPKIRVKLTRSRKFLSKLRKCKK